MGFGGICLKREMGIKLLGKHMELIRSFERIGKNDVGLAGGKGASLGEMTRAGIPVPPGFVVLSTAFDRFLEETKLKAEIDSILHQVNHSEMETVERASEEIHALILAQKMPADLGKEILIHFKKLGTEFVAVRSSATAEDSSAAAWAGQLETYLNTTSKNLVENVKKCWASLFTPRAIFYRFEKGLHDTHISVAVVVQKMVQSEISGIAFSVHPVTQDYNQLIIEAGLGLGEAIVSGQITPDSYILEKKPFSILEKNVSEQKRGIFRSEKGGNEWNEIVAQHGKQQKLSDSKINQLGKLVLRIETHYGFPVDVEWAFEKGTFYITQSRPITTLIEKGSLQKTFRKEDFLLSFWVQGVSVFVTDIHLKAYHELEVLYIIDHGTFKQYFTKKAYERALNRGLAFYSDKHLFENYKKDLSSHCDTFNDFFESKIKNKQTLSRKDVTTFFEYTKKLCGDYSKMNFEFTDKAFEHQDENPIIKKNLSGAATFKDTIRGVMNMVLFEPNGYLNQLFVILGKQFNLSPSIFDNLTQDEILGLFEGKKPNESNASKRQEAFVESYNLETFYEEKEANVIIQEFKEEVVHSDTIRGQTANIGKVVGTVKIIPVDYSNLSRVNIEIEKMQQGDILVAETTAPELMVACKKASAIVTDMGGLMSHAAIVSREFGIPCIVGTKNASKRLKDGDKVEVDADNGVIRILRSSSRLGNFEDYQRCFQWKGGGLPFLFSDIFMHHYQLLDCLIVHNQGTWTNFLPKTVVEKTLEEGKQLYSDAREFRRFETEFESYKRKSKAFFEQAIQKNDVTAKELAEGFDYFGKLFTYYSKTEFFYVDKAFEYSKKDHQTAANLKEFDSIKNEGRNFLNATFLGEKSYFSSLLRILSKKFSVDVDKLLLYRCSEILKLFENEKVSSPILAARKMSYVMKSTNNEITIFAGKEAQNVAEAFFQQGQQLQKNEFKGTIANKGNAKGTANIIEYGPSEFDRVSEIMGRMKKGDILVADTTSPEYMPACKKASAIITNQGGLMSHAAIVARELGIPCIVGLGDATQHIQTGDEIEVDADKGLVRILNKRALAKLVYRKLFTRDLEMVACEYWREGERVRLPKLCHNSVYFDPIFVYKKGRGVGVYYNYSDSQQDTENISKYYREHSYQFFEDMENYVRDCQRLMDLAKKERMEDFEQIRELIAHTWTGLAITNVVGKDTTIPKEMSKRAYEIRATHDHVTYDAGWALWRLIQKRVPGKLKQYTRFFTFDELKSMQWPTETELDARAKGFVYFQGKIFPDTTLEAFAKQHHFEIMEDEIPSTNELSGTVAYAGKVRGRARVIVEIIQGIAVKEGEIVVAPMTTPEFLPHMKKAAAFVTDEGGITCHAAIVARELKKPCIIGTKTATQKIVDGDEIEVDANTGIVRILKRA
jgi:phosphoenolpyruvate synthase/pyruvate phosphate dikinase